MISTSSFNFGDNVNETFRYKGVFSFAYFLYGVPKHEIWKYKRQLNDVIVIIKIQVIQVNCLI